jgi:hypothetical protein
MAIYRPSARIPQKQPLDLIRGSIPVLRRNQVYADCVDLFAVEYAQVIGQQHFLKSAPMRRFPPSLTAALSLLFVDISLQRSAEAEKCK